MMGRWDRYDDQEQFWKDMVIAFFHPDYDGMTATEALSDLYERRDQRRPTYE